MTDGFSVAPASMPVAVGGAEQTVTIQYGAESTVARWFNDYFTERDRKALPWLATTILVAFIMAGPGLLLWLASLLPVDQLGNSGASMRAHLILKSIAAMLASFAAIIIVKGSMRPSLIELSEKGIRKVWMIFGLIPLSGSISPWSELQSVRIFKRAGKTDPNDQCIFFETARRGDGPEAASSSDQPASGMKLAIREITGDDQRKSLFDAICKYADNIDPDIVDVLTPKRSLSFTEVWLDALSAPPGRQRLLPMEESVVLDARYKICRRLGAGGQGTVYLAEDLNEKCQIVLKETILPVYADLITRKQALEAFHKEAFALESTSHPNIVKFRRSFVADHRAYLVLDFVNGITLSETILKEGPFDCDRTIKLAIQMCDILDALHSQSPPLIHRDFTPDNLMVAQEGNLILIDFAVAVAGDRNSSDVAGKASYMAPEQFKGKPVEQSDIYSMGCTLYYLLTGMHPEPLDECWPITKSDLISQNLNDFVVRCTKYDVGERFASAKQAKQALLNQLI